VSEVKIMMIRQKANSIVDYDKSRNIEMLIFHN
jgi:hypothetical protein